jgi:predicted kinase
MVKIHGWNPPEEHFDRYLAQIENLIWEEATLAIRGGADVILDFGFWTRESRDAVRDRVDSIGAEPRFYEIRCPRQIMRARALERSKNTSTDSLWIDGAGYDKLIVKFEPMQEDEEFVRIEGST